MKRSLLFSSVAALAALFGAAQMVGCDSNEDVIARSNGALAACQLDDGTVELNADLRACDPDETHKTTICHIPPGNPANRHTLCIGNAGVPAHLENHGDYLGPCKAEPPCPPPTGGSGSGGGGDGGGDGGGTTGTAGNTGGGGNTGSTGGASGTGGTSGAGGVIIIVE